MKKIIISLMALYLMFSASAQTSSGDILLDAGTDFSFTTLKLNDIDPVGLNSTSQKSSGIELNASSGYFVIDGLVLGLTAIFSSDKVTKDGQQFTVVSGLEFFPRKIVVFGFRSIGGQCIS